MRQDNRLSGVLHVLLHLARCDEPMTSEVLAQAIQTNPVVIRRVLSGLRKQGYVSSEKGHGGGWRLAVDLADITLLDIYQALGSPQLLAIGHHAKSPKCLIEQAVNLVMEDAFVAAETQLRARFQQVTLAMLDQQIQPRIESCLQPGSHSKASEIETPET